MIYEKGGIFLKRISGKMELRNNQVEVHPPFNKLRAL